MSDQEIRAQALRAAVTIAAGKSWSEQDVLRLAEKYAAWIRTGITPPEQRW